MELEMLKAKLDELGKVLLAEDGFFAQMPEEQLNAFGEAIKLMARIQTLEVLNEKLSNGFTAKILPVTDYAAEMAKPTTDESMMTAMPPMDYMNPEMAKPTTDESMGSMIPCPACMSMPCVCGNQSEIVGLGSTDGMIGDMPKDLPEDMK